VRSTIKVVFLIPLSEEADGLSVGAIDRTAVRGDQSSINRFFVKHERVEDDLRVFILIVEVFVGKVSERELTRLTSGTTVVHEPPRRCWG
jgi:hypothetical protein